MHTKKRIMGLKYLELTDEEKQKIRETAPDFTFLDFADGYTKEQLAECEIIFGNIPPSDLKYAENLKWYHTQWAGVEAFFRQGAALPENLLFTNSSGAYGTAIAEHLLAMLTMLHRHMPQYVRNMQNKEWKYNGKVKSIYGSRVTVAGIGDIGGHFARRLHLLGANVTGIVRTKRGEYPAYLDAAVVSSDIDYTNKSLSEADIIALCLPETPDTINFLNRERIESLKSGVIILNVGRGSAIDQEALADGLESGQIGGAGLDVTTPEPLPENSRLWNFPNVIITPHVSGRDSLDYIHVLIVEKFLKYLNDYINGRTFDDIIDRTAQY